MTNALGRAFGATAGPAPGAASQTDAEDVTGEVGEDDLGQTVADDDAEDQS